MKRGAILHRGPMQRLFGDFPGELAHVLDVPVLDDDRDVDVGLVLAWDGPAPRCRTFVPFDEIVAALDKREQFRRFQSAGVSIPESRLFDDFPAAQAFALADDRRQWLLKWPLGSGAVGHAIARTAGGEHPTLRQHRDAVRDPADETHVVLDEQHPVSVVGEVTQHATEPVTFAPEG